MSRYPGAAWLPVTGHDGGPMRNPPLGLVLHVAEGNGSLRGYFQGSVTPDRKSSTWWAGKNGRLEQYLDSATEPWSQADGNATYASVETEGFATEPLTYAQITTLAGLYGWGHATHGWPLAAVDTPGQRGLILHSDGGAAWGGHACPGPIRAGQRAQILDAITNTAPTSPPLALEDDMRLICNGHEWSILSAAGRRHLGGPEFHAYLAAGVPAQQQLVPDALYQSFVVAK